MSTYISGRPTGENIGQHILYLLDSHGIMIEDCRGQAYDGASAMSSAVKGASAVIIKKTATGRIRSRQESLFKLGHRICV